MSDICTPASVKVLLWGRTRDNPCTGGDCANDDTPCVVSCGSNGPINGLPGLVDSGDGPCSGTNEAGCVRYANPSAAGTHLFYVYQQSQRDKDNDGKENTLDTCPLNYDTMDARASDPGDDTDGDRIANACDAVNNPGVTDQDGDGFKNTQDNCPIVANASQTESEALTPYATAAKRGGTRADGIGDACDPNPTRADGHYHSVLTAVPKCIGATDSDGDGWCSGDDPNDGNAGKTPEVASRHVIMWMANWGSGDSPPQSGEPLQQCNDGADNDGDGSTDTADSGCAALDIDGDGFSYATETHVGTNPQRPCDTAASPAEPNGFWPADFAGTGTTGTGGANRVTLADVTSFVVPAATRKFGTSPGQPTYNVRWDINPANPAINLADLTTLTAGPNGSPARPPFYDNGASPPNAAPKAFGNPEFCNDIFKP